MKKTIVLLTILFASVIFTNAQQQSSKSKMYFIKSGYLKTKMTGNTVGTTELWWDEYGQKTCTVEKSTTTVKVLGMKRKTENHKLEIVDNGQIWTVNYIDNTGVKTHVPPYNGKPINEMSEKEQEELANKVIDDLGGQRLGKEEYMGYNCELIELLGIKVWSYKNLPLKSDGNILGMKIQTTTEVFKPNTNVPASKFVAPTDIEYKEVEQTIDIADAMDGSAIIKAQQEAEKAEKAKNSDQDNDETVNDDDNIASNSTKYPYNKFMTKINAFKYNGFKKITAENSDGSHKAVFMKGLLNFLIVGITSKKNADMSQNENMERFTHKGKNYMYYVDRQNGRKTSFLVQESDTYDSFIVISLAPTKSKEVLLEIADALDL